MTFPLVPLRRTARILNGGTPPSGVAEFWDGEVPFVTPPDLNGLDGAPLDNTARTITADGVAHSGLAPTGSVLLSTRAPIGHIGWLTSPAAFNQGCRAIVPAPDHEARFLAYALVAARADMDARGLGTTFLELSGSSLAQIEVPLVPLEAQRAIADYLDRETAQIDAFVTKNEELIALLTERRGALIARAVLRGLDASVELRDSGVTWLGEVPSHWRVSRLSRWFEVTLGKMLDEAKFAGTVGDVLPYVRASNIKAERLDLSDVKSMPFTPPEQAKVSLRSGDLVVVEGGSIGVNAPIEKDMYGWGFQKTVNRVRAIRGDFTRFLGYQIDVIREAGVLNMITNVSTIQHLTAEKLERMVVAMPPAVEQEAIVRHIRRATSAIDRAVETAEEGVRLARERRAALILAAVTGKIDVGVAV